MVRSSGPGRRGPLAVETISYARVRGPLARLPADSGAGRRARGVVIAATARPGLAWAREPAALIASELATNAALHGSPPVLISVVPGADKVVIAVFDTSPNLPRRAEPSEFATHGRGLAIVDSFSSAWEVEVTPGGKWVWAEVWRPTTERQTLDGWAR